MRVQDSNRSLVEERQWLHSELQRVHATSEANSFDLDNLRRRLQEDQSEVRRPCKKINSSLCLLVVTSGGLLRLCLTHG